MPFDKDFWSKLATKHGLSKEAVEAIAANEALMHDIDEMVLRRDEYRGLREQTDAEKRAAEQARTEAVKKYQENLTWFNQKQTDLATLDKYREAYPDFDGTVGGGNGRRTDGNGNGGGNNGVTLKPEDIEKRILKAQYDGYTLNKQMIRAMRHYEKTFNEDFPLDEIEAIAQKPENQSRSLNEIYNEWVAPKVKAKENSEWEAKLKAAREEGEKAGIAKGRMREPTSDLSPENLSPIWHPAKPDAKPDDVTLQRNFVETFETVDAKS